MFRRRFVYFAQLRSRSPARAAAAQPPPPQVRAPPLPLPRSRPRASPRLRGAAAPPTRRTQRERHACGGCAARREHPARARVSAAACLLLRLALAHKPFLRLRHQSAAVAHKSEHSVPRARPLSRVRSNGHADSPQGGTRGGRAPLRAPRPRLAACSPPAPAPSVPPKRCAQRASASGFGSRVQLDFQAPASYCSLVRRPRTVGGGLTSR